MAKNRGLGRGLDAIFDDNSVEKENKGVTTLRLSSVEPKKDQPRKYFDNEALSSLADSIAQSGVLQPILVRETGDGIYTIIAGERRWRASKLAGLSEIPAIIIDADDITAAKIAMIENLQREDLNPMEEAIGYAELMKKYSLTQEAVATEIGKSRSAIANSLRLLDLPEDVRDMLVSGSLSAGHGRTLLGLRDRAKILPLAEKTVLKGFSVRELEAAVRKENNSKPDKEEVNEAKVDYLADLEEKLSSSLGRRCVINCKGKKKSVNIEFSDNDDLDTLLTQLCGGSPVND